MEVDCSCIQFIIRLINLTECMHTIAELLSCVCKLQCILLRWSLLHSTLSPPSILSPPVYSIDVCHRTQPALQLSKRPLLMVHYTPSYCHWADYITNAGILEYLILLTHRQTAMHNSYVLYSIIIHNLFYAPIYVLSVYDGTGSVHFIRIPNVM